MYNMGMTTKCPECQTPIDEDFGLVTCTSCGISLFIDMNGEARSSEYTSTHHILQGPFSDINDSSNQDEINGFSDPAPPKPEDFIISRETPAEDKNTQNEEVFEDINSPEAHVIERSLSVPTEEELDEIDKTFTKIKSLKELENESWEQEPSQQEEAADYQEESGIASEDDQNFGLPDIASSVQFEEDESFDDETQEDEDRVEVDPSDLGDVAAFGNSSASLAADGLLRYDVFISGIDSGELKKDFYEAINDKRFLWDAELLMTQIKQGRLKINNISAVKAMILISRLRYMPIKVKWDQYAINEL